MNCANHPDAAVAAFCQNCGKALCAQCVRSVSGVIYCEQCLAAKLGIGGVAAAGGYTVSGTTAGGVNYAVNGVIAPSGPNPSTATVLGFIPGVGAMYNGQFVKALVHVLVFVILIGITHNHPIFGLFIAAWIFYQVFDAHQTAKARRDGLPLPDPFGLNELGAKIGIPNSTIVPPVGPGPIPGAGPIPGPIPGPVPGSTQAYSAAPGAPFAGPPPGFVPPGAVPPVAGFTPGAGYTDPYAPYASPVPPIEPFASDPGSYSPRRREPIGAIVLIALGLLFLLNTLGFFRFDWVGHFWPLFIIALGAWLLIRRTRDIPPPPSPPTGGGQ